MDTEEVSCDSLRWREVGLTGSFSAVECRSIRIGSYKFTPNSRVFFSNKGIMLQAPIFCPSPQQRESTSPASNLSWIDVAIPVDKLLKVQAHFTRKLPVIFLNVTPTCSKFISKQIGLPKSGNGPRWSALSQIESEKLLTLLPVSLDDAAKNAIKQAFVGIGVFDEIGYDKANKILMNSSPPADVCEALGRLPSSISTVVVPASTSRNNAASKENVSKHEVSFSVHFYCKLNKKFHFLNTIITRFYN